MKHIAIAALLISIIPIYLTVQAIQASIDYWLEKRESFTIGPNPITIYCKNGGEIDGDFYLILTFTNATFLANQTTQPFIEVDKSTVKIPFGLHKDERYEKLVYFSVNQTVNEFSISLSLERMNFFSLLKANPRYPIELHYRWDANTNRFIIVE